VSGAAPWLGGALGPWADGVAGFCAAGEPDDAGEFELALLPVPAALLPEPAEDADAPAGEFPPDPPEASPD
jgi:hypothetical protein